MEDRYPNPLALCVKGIGKAFDAPVLHNLSFGVRCGELYALLGHNGAGKTTTLRIIAGLLNPDEGTVRVSGVSLTDEPIEARRHMAWLPDEPMIYDMLTPSEYLAFMGGLWKVASEVARERTEVLLKWLDLWERRDERCEAFSRGMRQKVALAGALVHDPKLLLLDEPLTGLDVGAVRQVKKFLRNFVRNGGAVVLTTHILDVAERIADRIGIIHDGSLIAEGTLEELRANSPQHGASLEDIFINLVSQQPE